MPAEALEMAANCRYKAAKQTVCSKATITVKIFVDTGCQWTIASKPDLPPSQDFPSDVSRFTCRRRF